MPRPVPQRLQLSHHAIATVHVVVELVARVSEPFSHLLPRLTNNEPRRLARADLRYTNGFALVWGPAPAAPTAIQGMHESQG